MMLKTYFRCRRRHSSIALHLSALVIGAASLAQADPLASNNGFYPEADEYSGGFNLANLDYPTDVPPQTWELGGGIKGPLTKDNALEYMMALKDHIEPTMRVLVEDPANWDAAEAGWYNTMWRGAGNPNDPTSGREALMNTHTGQIVPSESWDGDYKPTTEFMQNYGAIYYNPMAAYTLGQVWDDPLLADPDSLIFNDGSIVVKVEAATVQPEEWPWGDPNIPPSSVLEGAASWQVYRPTTENQKAHQRDPSVELVNVVQTVYPFQMAIKVKDSVAVPSEDHSGWIFMGFVYDASVLGASVWDKFKPVGLMWGNDPQFSTHPEGKPEGKELLETWINENRPPFIDSTLGWGGRFAAPMDVAVRHEVVLPSGERHRGADGFEASSCLSCHGAGQFPFMNNIYPSPNRYFPPDGDQFLMYEPGSDKWAEWFQNRQGYEPQSPYSGVVATDYDLNNMIALGIWAGATGASGEAFEVINGH